MTTIHFPQHHWAHCTNQYCTGCHLCHGGLAVCTRCGGMEGSLPTDCPGERMTADQQAAVYAGDLDWRRRAGWVSESSPYSPAHYQRKP